jgi:hypothetical protein
VNKIVDVWIKNTNETLTKILPIEEKVITKSLNKD